MSQLSTQTILYGKYKKKKKSQSLSSDGLQSDQGEASYIDPLRINSRIEATNSKSLSLHEYYT